MKPYFVSSILSLIAIATSCAGSFTEDFGKEPFLSDHTIVGQNGWILRSASQEFGNDAASIRSGGPGSSQQSLELVSKGQEATTARRIISPPLQMSASENNRISVDLLYENPHDFKMGVIYAVFATSNGAVNMGLMSGEAGNTGVAFVDIGGKEQRLFSPPNTFKAGTWYRFVVDLYQGVDGKQAKISMTPVTKSGDAKPVWETVVEMDSFRPTSLVRIDLSVARTGRFPAIRIGRVGAVSLTTAPR
jgi:hypothetical protein